ncbi:MAG: T9SS type A sorting domain-containing protein [Bacteroidales bacterium]|nr:T9SS type A sorting domain-containing protein [Bacteroidales bacterium]
MIPTNVYGEFRHTYSNSYYLTVTDLATGCIYRDTVHVEIDSLPIIVLPDTLVTCTGNEVTFDFADEAVRYYDELEWTDKYSATRIRGRYDINPTFIYYDDFMEGYSVADLFVTGKGACTRHESNHSMVVILGEFFDLGLRSTVSGCSGEDGVTIEFESPYRDNALDYYWIQDGQQIRSERMHRDGLERDSTYRYVDTLVAISLDGCKRVERVRITLYRRPFIYNAEYDTINLGDGITLEAVCDASPARNPKLQWFEIQTDGNPLKITEGVGSVNVTPTYTTTYIAMNIPAVMSSCNANDTVTVVVINGTKTPSDFGLSDTVMCDFSCLTLGLPYDDGQRLADIQWYLTDDFSFVCRDTVIGCIKYNYADTVYATDTLYGTAGMILSRDTNMTAYVSYITDEIVISDSLRYGGLVGTDTILEICPRLTQTYEVYKMSDVVRLRDSAAYYFGVADSLDRQLAVDMANGTRRPSIEVFVLQDTLAMLDADAPLPDDNPIYHAHSHPYAARARAEAYLKQAVRYETAIAKGQNIRLREHMLDTLHFVLYGRTNTGDFITDTFTVSRMPIPYCHIGDTGVLYGKEVILWTKEGYCDADSAAKSHDPFLSRGESALHVAFSWLDPFYGDYAGGVTPHVYGDPATDLPADRYNTTGHPLANVNNPYYLADTLDGDTLYFPITVKNDDARDPYGCAVTDTVAVTIYRGHHISGYISYNGLWHPSDKGITRPEVLATPDEPVTDADAGLYGQGRHGTHMPLGNVRLDLYEYGTNKRIDSARSDEDGLFTFTQLVTTGRYFVDAYSPQKKVHLGLSGISAHDASWIQQYAIGAMPTPPNPLSMWWYAANVDLSESPILTKGISANDASAVQQVAIGAMTQYVKNLVIPIDDWAYSNDTFMLADDTHLHVRGIMRGDANRSYEGYELNSQLTKSGKIHRFDTYGNIGVENRDRIIDYPILSVSEGDIRAFQLFMPYDASKVEILGVSSPVAEANVVYNFINDELLFNWICPYPVEVHTGDTLAMLKLHLQHRSVSRIDRCFRLNPTGYEVTLSDLQIDPGWRIALPEVTFYDDEKYLESDSSDFNEVASSTIDGEIRFERQDGKSGLPEIVSVVPNPMQARAEITYSVYDEGIVNLKLYTVLGEEVRSVVNSERQSGTNHRDIVVSDLPTGIYVLRLEVLRDNFMETDVVKVVVQK